MRAALVIAALAVPAAAHANPTITFEVADRGDSVEVIAHNVEAKTTKVSSVRSRIEVPVTGQPMAGRQVMTDSTVLLVEFDGISNRVLSIKTKLDRPEVKALAGLATATQVGTDLHLTFPRHAIETAAKPVEIKPAPVAAIPPVAKPEPKLEPKLETKLEPKPEPKPEPKLEATPVPVETHVAAKPLAKLEPQPATPTPLTHPMPTEKESTFTSPGMYALGALVTLLACGYVLKKKKKDSSAVSTIDVIAQRALGNKAKVMWLSAGGREMILSVTNTNVRLLGQWSKSDADALPRATSLENRPSKANLDSFREEFKQELAEANAVPSLVGNSSAVSGILKLRARTSTGQIPARAPTHLQVPLHVNADVATEDEEADLEWAKEILTATGGRR